MFVRPGATGLLIGIELYYGYQYLLEVCSELSDICFLIWLCYHMMLALHDRPVLVMVKHIMLRTLSTAPVFVCLL